MSARTIRAPRGAQLTCKGWHQEAALRCLMNNLDPEVAEKPDELIVYGGAGKAARNWPAFEAIVRSLQELEGDETLLIQSGKPVGVFRTHEYESGWRVGELEPLSRARAQRVNDVRPDDRGQLDLHRHAGHRAGHV